MSTGFLEQFAEWAANNRLSCPSKALEEARLAYIDTIACIIAGQDQPLSTKIHQLNQSLHSESSVMGTAMLYACQAGILDYDDYESAGSSHPSAPIIAAVLAFLEQKKFTVQQVLEAWIAGYEIIVRMGQSLGYDHYEKGWHSTSTLGSIAASVAIGRLINLSPQEMLRAMSLASSSSAGMKLQFGTEAKVVHEGLAAQAGIQAALLAHQRVRAYPDFYDGPDGFRILYGTKNSKPLNQLISSITLGHGSIDFQAIRKPWPACAYTQRIIEAGEKLHHQISSLAEIAHVIINIPEPWMKVVRFHRPTSDGEARFSSTYCVMMAIRSGALGPADFTNEIFLDPERLKLTDLARVESFPVTKGFTEMSPAFPDTVTIVLKNGETISENIGHVMGGKERPMTADDLKLKFEKCSKNLSMFDQILNADLSSDAQSVLSF
ncbi:MAG: hypothetical protein MAG581_02626 [Deltaproteobacteria bacterium]|nr:hypothetical protein [Deltaproteobacteria bacterium]